MESYLVLKDLAIIVIAAKLFGIVARKLKAPQVVGEIIAGLIIGGIMVAYAAMFGFDKLQEIIGWNKPVGKK